MSSDRRVNASRSRDSAMAGVYASAPDLNALGRGGPGHRYAPEIHLGRPRGVYDRAPVRSPRGGLDTRRPLRRESPRGHRRRVGRSQFDEIDIAGARQPAGSTAARRVRQPAAVRCECGIIIRTNRAGRYQKPSLTVLDVNEIEAPRLAGRAVLAGSSRDHPLTIQRPADGLGAPEVAQFPVFPAHRW